MVTPVTPIKVELDKPFQLKSSREMAMVGTLRVHASPSTYYDSNTNKSKLISDQIQIEFFEFDDVLSTCLSLKNSKINFHEYQIDLLYLDSDNGIHLKITTSPRKVKIKEEEAVKIAFEAVKPVFSRYSGVGEDKLRASNRKLSDGKWEIQTELVGLSDIYPTVTIDAQTGKVLGVESYSRS